MRSGQCRPGLHSVAHRSGSRTNDPGPLALIPGRARPRAVPREHLARSLATMVLAVHSCSWDILKQHPLNVYEDRSNESSPCAKNAKDGTPASRESSRGILDFLAWSPPPGI